MHYLKRISSGHIMTLYQKPKKRRGYELTKDLVKTFFDASLKHEEKKYDALSEKIARFKDDFLEYEIRD